MKCTFTAKQKFTVVEYKLPSFFDCITASTKLSYTFQEYKLITFIPEKRIQYVFRNKVIPLQIRASYYAKNVFVNGIQINSISTELLSKDWRHCTIVKTVPPFLE